ncbi:hypothetical protein BGZ73_005960 [Actinomortierella ambigua]|nr:hypothetical protein BGZ73_005960 [Actinomortierella ambigua]
MKGLAAVMSSWVLVAIALLAMVSISETSAIVIPFPGVETTNGPAPYVEIRDDNAPSARTMIEVRHDNTPIPGAYSGAVGGDQGSKGNKGGRRSRHSKRGGGTRDRQGYVPGGPGSGNQYDKGKPYGRSL